MEAKPISVVVRLKSFEETHLVLEVVVVIDQVPAIFCWSDQILPYKWQAVTAPGGGLGRQHPYPFEIQLEDGTCARLAGSQGEVSSNFSFDFNFYLEWCDDEVNKIYPQILRIMTRSLGFELAETRDRLRIVEPSPLSPFGIFSRDGKRLYVVAQLRDPDEVECRELKLQRGVWIS